MKSRGIISTVRDPSTGYSKYDMNDIGFEILKELENKPEKSKACMLKIVFTIWLKNRKLV